MFFRAKNVYYANFYQSTQTFRLIFRTVNKTFTRVVSLIHVVTVKHWKLHLSNFTGTRNLHC